MKNAFILFKPCFIGNFLLIYIEKMRKYNTLYLFALLFLFSCSSEQSNDILGLGNNTNNTEFYKQEDSSSLDSDIVAKQPGIIGEWDMTAMALSGEFQSTLLGIDITGDYIVDTKERNYKVTFNADGTYYITGSYVMTMTSVSDPYELNGQVILPSQIVVQDHPIENVFYEGNWYLEDNQIKGFSLQGDQSRSYSSFETLSLQGDEFSVDIQNFAIYDLLAEHNEDNNSSDNAVSLATGTKLEGVAVFTRVLELEDLENIDD